MIDRLRMALEQRFHLREIDRLGIGLGERHVDVVVKDADESGFPGKIQNAIERRVCQAGGFARDLRGDEFLVNRELADARNTPGNVLSTRRM